MELDNWKTQLRKGLLELCVLNLLREREYHGYDLVRELKQMDGMYMREGTVYPILARFEEDGLVTSFVRPSDAGPPRKYFRITPLGERAVSEMNAHWTQVQAAVRAAQGVREEKRNDG
jgi:PadR family transcriptional regulator, regulatory protein PadR